MAFISRLCAVLRHIFGLSDLAFLAGLCALGYGIYAIDTRFAFIAVGAIVVLLTTLGRFLK